MKTRLLLLALLSSACASDGAPAPATASRGPALPAQVVDMDGGSHALADRAAGRPVALVFWQVWCASCRAEAPELARAAAEHGGRIEFLGVVPGPDTLVDDAKVRETAASWGLPYPSVRDRDLALTNALGVEGTPTIIVLGEDQRVLYRGHEPPPDWGALR